MARPTLLAVLQWPDTRLDAAVEGAAQAGLLTPPGDAVDVAHDTLRGPLLRRVEPAIRDRWALAIRRAGSTGPAPLGPAPTRDTGPAVAALLHAGRQALRSLAFDEASRIGALAVDLARPGSLDAAEARFIQARGISDDRGDHRLELLRDAWRRAQELDDHDLMVRVAIELAGPWGPGTRIDHDAVERMRTVASVVTDPGLRSQVLGRIVSFTLGQADDAQALASEAWDDALEVGDAEGLCAAGHARCYAMLGRSSAKERGDIARECLDLAERAGLYERAAGLANHLFVAAAALDQADDLDRSISSYARAAEVTARPTHRWRVAFLEASRAMADGDLAAAEALSADAAAMGDGYELEDAAANRAIQAFCINLQAEELDRLRPFAPRADERPLAIASRLAAAVGRGLEAEVAVERVRARQALLHGPKDYLWPGAAYLLQWAAQRLEDDELAAAVADQVRPLRGERAVVGMGMGVLGTLLSAD
jgi:hypothetical protein